MTTKFTFKNNKETGRHAWASSESHEIKLDKKKIGTIYEQSHLFNAPLEEKFKVQLAVVDTTQVSNWRWIVLKAKFPTSEKAKEFLNNNFELLNKTYNFHKFEN